MREVFFHDQEFFHDRKRLISKNVVDKKLRIEADEDEKLIIKPKLLRAYIMKTKVSPPTQPMREGVRCFYL